MASRKKTEKQRREYALASQRIRERLKKAFTKGYCYYIKTGKIRQADTAEIQKIIDLGTKKYGLTPTNIQYIRQSAKELAESSRLK